MKFVNSLFLGLILLASASEAEARFFACKAVAFDLKRDETSHSTLPISTKNSIGGDVGTVIFDAMSALCQSGKDRYRFSMAGVGGALHINNAYFTLSCPLVGKRRFHKKSGARFVGTRVSLSAVGGLTGGVFMNHALGTCVLSGVTLGIGASASLAAIKVTRIDSDHPESDIDEMSIGDQSDDVFDTY